MRMMRWFQCSSLSGRAAGVAVALLLLGMASCGSLQNPVRRPSAEVEPGWPKGHQPWQETRVLQAGWTEGKQFWDPVQRESFRASLPFIEGAHLVGHDEFCEGCHETYAMAFANNVHRDQQCEACHGAASRHTKGRGELPDSILSFRPPEETGSGIGKPVSAAERSEICLQCHEDPSENPLAPCDPGAAWRTSTHAHQGMACTDCHRNHYNVPLGTPPVDAVTKGDPQGQPSPDLPSVGLIRYQGPGVEESPRGKSHSLQAFAPDDCYECHEDKRRMEEIVHPHQIGVPFDFHCTQCHDPPPRGAPRDVEHHLKEFNCTTCHDPHGGVLPETRKDLCLKCHDNAHLGRWHSSPHNVAGVACTDCHDPHSQTGPPMYVDQPQVCYRCHGDKQELEEIAHPHQVGGPNGFECITCHDPHGKVLAYTRRGLCLECHDGAPTMAWHSSIHDLNDVACVDCHNPHPRTELARVVQVSHTAVKRPPRLPMSVDEPAACYKCHPKIFGMAALPSHHPIREGKMVCSDCHDAHGQAERNLKEDTVNELCYECHAEKEGPFVYEHPPVTENCGNCHNPHGTVANNLLKQPTVFLCLRCHSGHATHDASPQCTRCHFVDGDFVNVGGGPLDPMSPTTPTARRALFTDCTQCHGQVHGSDVPAGFVCGNRLAR